MCQCSNTHRSYNWWNEFARKTKYFEFEPTHNIESQIIKIYLPWKLYSCVYQTPLNLYKIISFFLFFNSIRNWNVKIDWFGSISWKRSREVNKKTELSLIENSIIRFPIFMCFFMDFCFPLNCDCQHRHAVKRTEHSVQITNISSKYCHSFGEARDDLWALSCSMLQAFSFFFLFIVCLHENARRAH